MNGWDGSEMGRVELMHQMDLTQDIGLWMVGWDAFVDRYRID